MDSSILKQRATAPARRRPPFSAVFFLTILIIGLLVDGAAAKRTIVEDRTETRIRTTKLNTPKARAPTPRVNVPKGFNTPKARSPAPRVTTGPKIITVPRLTTKVNNQARAATHKPKPIKPTKANEPQTRPSGTVIVSLVSGSRAVSINVPKRSPQPRDNVPKSNKPSARSPQARDNVPKSNGPQARPRDNGPRLNTPQARVARPAPSRPSGMTTVTTRQRAAVPSDVSFVAEADGYLYKGCYGHGRAELTGQVLGVDFLMPTNASVAERMTVPTCTGACRELGKGFEFVGLGGGKDCYCGTTLSPTAREVLETNCTSPCAGDRASYCGGTGYVLVYSLAGANEVFGAKTAGAGLPSLSATPSETSSSTTSSLPTTTVSAPESSTTATADDLSPSPSRSPAQTAAIVVGSIVGALIFTALAALLVKLLSNRRTQPQPNSYSDPKAPFDSDYPSTPHPDSNLGFRADTALSPTSPQTPSSPRAGGKAGMGMALMRVHSNRIVTPLTSPVHYRRRSSEVAGDKSPSTAGLMNSFPTPPRNPDIGGNAVTSSVQPYDLGSVSSSSATTVGTSILSVSTMHSSTGRAPRPDIGVVTAGVGGGVDTDPYAGMPVSPISMSDGRSLTSPARVADVPGLGPRASNRRRFSRAFGPGDEEDGLGMGFEAGEVGVARGSGIGIGIDFGEGVAFGEGRDEDGMLPLVPAYTNWTVDTASQVSGKGRDG